MGGSIRVLIVEDSEDDAVLIERELRRGGLEAVTERVETAAAMRAALDRQAWDVVIADYSLPRFSAPAALALLEERGLDLPFIVISGSIGEQIAVATMKAGAHDYIMKSDLTRLVPAVERELREAAGRRERRLAEEQLRVSEARYASLFENASDALAVADEDWTVIDVNPACCDLFGYRREELVGMHVGDVGVPPEGRERLPEMLRSLKETGAIRGETAVLHRDGSRRIVEMNAKRAAPGLYMAVMRDVTERRALERQLLQAQKMESIGTLAGGIAHDFNNILTGIAGFAELALMRLSSAHPIWRDLQEVKRQAERATTLTRQLLAFSRRQILEPKHVNLNQVVSETEAFLRRVIGEHIELKVVTAPKLATVYVDPAQVEQVLMNLCVNARDAMPQGGQLLIETRDVRLDESYCRSHAWARPGDYVEIAVTDTGVGMDEKTLQQIFDPFFTTKEPGKGTGLGLAMVYGIVRQHDGLIHVYSEPGRGTTFTVYFRAVAAEPERIVRSEAVMPLGGRETILVAEDDETVRALITRILEERGYTVLATADGEEALRRFDAEPERIALVVADAVMPRLAGRELYEALRARKPGLRVLFISGYSANSIHERFILDAGLDFLHKPFNPVELARRVREVLDR